MNSTNARVFLWLGLVLALWLNYETWVKDYGPKPGEAPSTAVTATPGVDASRLAASIPSSGAPAAVANPAALAGTAPVAAAAAPVAAPAATAAVSAVAAGGTVTVRTDVLEVDIALTGGELQRADLLVYPQVKGERAPVRLLNRDPQGFYVLQTGLAGPAGTARPTHLAPFTAQAAQYTLAAGVDELRVPLAWTDPAAGVLVTKTFVFRRGQYRVDLEYEVRNDSLTPFPVASYSQLLRDDLPIDHGECEGSVTRPGPGRSAQSGDGPGAGDRHVGQGEQRGGRGAQPPEDHRYCCAARAAGELARYATACAVEPTSRGE